jgi:predicted DNA-binding protein
MAKKNRGGRPKAIGATKEKILSVRMESSAAAAIETISGRFGVSSAYLIRQAINEFVARNIGATTLTVQATGAKPTAEDEPTKNAPTTQGF